MPTEFKLYTEGEVASGFGYLLIVLYLSLTLFTFITLKLSKGIGGKRILGIALRYDI